MKKSIISVSLFFSCISITLGQSIENIDWNVKEKKIEIKYDLQSISDSKTYKIEVYVSLDSGKTFSQQMLKFVTGDAGLNVNPGKHKKIIWDISKELPDIKEGMAVFDIRAIEMIEKTKREFYLGYKGSISAPFGLTFGTFDKPGIYIAARFNQNVFIKPEYNIDKLNNPPPDGWKYVPDNGKKQRLSIIAGLQFKLNETLFLQTGLGFAKYNNLWKLTSTADDREYSWVNFKEGSFISYEIEAALLFKIKHFYLNLGGSSYNLKYVDLVFGAGIVF